MLKAGPPQSHKLALSLPPRVWAHFSGSSLLILTAIPHLSRKVLHHSGGTAVPEPKPNNNKPQRLSLKCLHRFLAELCSPPVHLSESVEKQVPTLGNTQKPNAVTGPSKHTTIYLFFILIGLKAQGFPLPLGGACEEKHYEDIEALCPHLMKTSPSILTH